MFGLPKMPPQLSFHRDSWEEEPNLELEESWKQLLENPEVNTLPYPENCFENFYIDRLGCNNPYYMLDQRYLTSCATINLSD